MIGPVVTLPACGVTAPIPLSMVTEVAFEVDQLSVDLPPAATAVGCAENWMVGGIWFTVTVVLVEAVAPPDPVAVMV